MSNTLVDYRTEAGVATITLNDPPMNAYTHEMMKELDDAILDARFDNDVHVIVVTGYGESFFCAGRKHQHALARSTPTFKYYFCLHANETLNRLENTPKLVIAALNGHAVGGGLEIALACDLRIARTRRGQDRPARGQSRASCPARAGRSGRPSHRQGEARYSSWSKGPTWNSSKRCELGLVNYVWEAETSDAFHAKVVEYARQFLPPEQGAASPLGAIKRSVQSGLEMSLEQGPRARTRAPGRALRTSEDAKEGREGLRRKAQGPQFRGHAERRRSCGDLARRRGGRAWRSGRRSRRRRVRKKKFE